MEQVKEEILQMVLYYSDDCYAISFMIFIDLIHVKRSAYDIEKWTKVFRETDATRYRSEWKR